MLFISTNRNFALTLVKIAQAIGLPIFFLFDKKHNIIFNIRSKHKNTLFYI